jgi:hypothetical protein
MKYRNEDWGIEKLIKLCNGGHIDLSPPYQRNPIWTSRAQKLLVDTINKNQPIPNFFVREISKKKMEMVDGQQRARTILSYYKKQLKDLHGNTYNDEKTFLQYVLNVTIISNLQPDESIEEYYALVNSSGLRLNRPELKKAEYYNTRFLVLLNTLVDLDEFQELNLFTASSVNRMNDVELASELVALLKYGIFEKKSKVDDLYESDITEEEYEELFEQFQEIMKIFSRLNATTQISKTRYRQRNDFYTLFHFFNQIKGLDPETINYFYQIMLRVGPAIKPSQEDCEPLQDYAVNCVTQSNSKSARKARNQFLVELLLNTKNKPNPTQVALMDFFDLDEGDMANISGYLTFDHTKLIRKDFQL